MSKIKGDESNKDNFLVDEEEQNEIINKFKTFYDLNPCNIKIKSPYNFNSALDILDKLTIEQFTNGINEIIQKEINLDFLSNKNNVNFSLNNILFLTTKTSINASEYILLNDFKKEEYITIPKYEISKNDIINTGMNIRIYQKEDGKKEINIKCIINYEKFSYNIIHNLMEKSNFEKSKEILKKSKNYMEKELINKNFEFDMKIFSNTINRIIYTDNGEYILDLQCPPKFRTNFLIDEKKDLFKNNTKKEFTYYENIMFPFRNFQDEISNLKYRHFYILLKKDKNIYNENDNIENLQNALGSIFVENDVEIDKKIFLYQKEIKILSEKKIKSSFYKNGEYELSDYFKYNSDNKIYEILKNLKFIKKEESDDNNEFNKIKPDDEEVIKLFYQIVALISEGILSYYTAIEFVENILFNKTINYFTKIFSILKNTDLYPIFFNLVLTKLLNKYQNSLEEQTLPIFEINLKNTFNSLYAEYITKGLNEILKPSKNPVLTNVQRCILTPTYILFTPYILDQGNRILRDFLNSTNLSMLCVFKMDNFEEGKWNNKFLIEYIKYVMEKGFYIGEKKFRFFNFSQSQFRNMSCWLLTEPEKILSQTGDYSKIKIVAKFGSRVSQTLTTTIKTIKIPNDHIIYINDVLIKKIIKDEKGNKREIEYNFSDGVGKISYNLAELIAKSIHLNHVPGCFQGRFLGCKGVWTTIYDDMSGNIYIRPSQEKFKIKNFENKDNYFELCDYSRYIQAYLNRQVILLMRANGIPDGNFMKKLFEYVHHLENEKFVLSLVHYNEWNNLFQLMNSCGINKTNDRLMKSLLESNLQILYNDIKNKARIYIKDSAYVIGIMDEFGILEYGQAFLHIKRRKLDLILNKKCTIAKCPCLHPGDVRILDFKKYIPGDESTEKYKIFERYENVLIFPSKGKRPHPNECSGSDLDGDNYFVFYDEDLILDENNISEPMNYTFNLNPIKKDNIQIKDVIEYFAEYTNLNNLGIIGDAHLALCDKDPKHAKGEIPIRVAQKFSRAVDAPKTGDDVSLDEEENPKKFPHYMCKAPSKSYYSNFILGRLFDEVNKIIDSVTKKKEISKFYYDNKLELNGWEKFALMAMVFYRDFFEEMFSLMKKIDVKGESILLTGNNIDNDESVYTKRKNNYDLREKIADEMRRMFSLSKSNFEYGVKIFFLIKNFEFPILKGLNEELFFRNNLNLFASACYMISYNFFEIINEKKVVEKYGKKFKDMIFENIEQNNDLEYIGDDSEVNSYIFGIDYRESFESNINEYYYKFNNKKKLISDIIQMNINDMKNFVEEAQKFKIPKNPDDESQYRILSFPWCIAGLLLSQIKFLNLD